MTIEQTEVVDGYRVRWLTTETKASVKEALSSGDCDGVGFNPYRGWSGNVADFLNEPLGAKALLLPFADRVGFTGELLSCQRNLEMLLLSEFSGVAHIQGESLRVLRLLLKSGITLGGLPSLHTLYLRDPTSGLIQQLPEKVNRLAVLQLNGGALSTIEGVERLQGLKHIELLNLKKLKSISPLAKGLRLHTLIIESTRGLNDLECTLRALESLRVLRLIDCGMIESFGFLDRINLDEFRCSRTKVAQPHHPALSRIKTVFVG